MNIVKLLSLYSLALIAAYGCTGKTANENEHKGHEHHQVSGNPAATEVMAMHDSVMLKMGVMMQLSDAIRVRIVTLDSISKAEGEASGNQADAIKKANVLVTELDQAQEEMMSWMHQFRPDTLDDMTKENAAHYIEEQRELILEVKSKMETSIQNAQFFLKR